MKIVFIGSNPSVKAGNNMPFWKNTKSAKILDSWINQIPPIYGSTPFIYYLNVSNSTTPNNRSLKMSEIKAALPRLEQEMEGAFRPDKIIALGKTAEKALTLLRVDFYAMPHPSGLNRKLNDPKYVEEKINGLKNYLSPSKI